MECQITLDSGLSARDTRSMRSRVAGPISALAAAGVAAAGVVAVASAGGSGDSGIKGRVVPCGLIHERAAPCATSAAKAKVIVRRAPGGRALAVVRADAKGAFRVPMGAGSYVVEARPKGTPARTKPVDIPAVVPHGGWVTIVVPAGRMAAPIARG
jgi:hypothetical protein